MAETYELQTVVKQCYGALPLSEHAHRLTPKTIINLIQELFGPQATAHQGCWCWVGAGDATECIVLEKILGDFITFYMLEINENARLEGTIKIQKCNSNLQYSEPHDVLQVSSLPNGITHVYTIAPVGDEFYFHIVILACQCPTVVQITMYTRFFLSLNISKKYLKSISHFTVYNTKLSGGKNEQWQLLSLALNDVVKQKLMNMLYQDQDQDQDQDQAQDQAQAQDQDQDQDQDQAQAQAQAQDQDQDQAQDQDQDQAQDQDQETDTDDEIIDLTSCQDVSFDHDEKDSVHNADDENDYVYPAY